MFFNAPVSLEECIGNAEILYSFDNIENYSIEGFHEIQRRRDIFIPCEINEHDGRIELRYRSDNLRNFAALYDRMNPKSFISIIADFIDIILEIKNNPYLFIENVDVSFDHVFIDMKTLRPYVICLPLTARITDDIGQAIESRIASQIEKTISRFKNINSDSTDAILDMLPQTDGLERLSKILNETKQETVARKPSDTIPLLQQLVMKKDLTLRDNRQNSWESSALLTTGTLGAFRPKLILSGGSNVPRPVSILIDKPEFIIGKSDETADGVVEFNQFISQKHCRFVFDKNKYYLEDLDSTNRTFVNGKRIEPYERIAVKPGDIIRLANSEFILKNF